MTVESSDSPTVAAIYKTYEEKKEDRRNYLGASVIGKPCHRALWYEFRWCGREQFDGRMLRLFETGHLEEARIIASLRGIGCEVYDRDEAGEQIGFINLSGHFRGHLDSMILGIPEAPKTWHVGEFKTHNEKSFKALQAKGVKESKPEHYAQMQCYMHETKTTRAIYIAANKNTSELYSERINYDEVEAESILASARKIIESKSPPAKIDGPSSFACKWCSHHSRCHGNPTGPSVPCDVTCRSCCHATPIIDDGQSAGWHCAKHNRHLSEADQAKACPDHIFIPDLVTFAKAIDGTDDEVMYENDSGNEIWTNGKGASDYSSVKLTQIAISQIKKTTKAVNEIPF
jgi:hypothetical protein